MRHHALVSAILLVLIFSVGDNALVFADSDVTPLNIVISDEVWSLNKQ